MSQFLYEALSTTSNLAQAGTWTSATLTTSVYNNLTFTFSCDQPIIISYSYSDDGFSFSERKFNLIPTIEYQKTFPILKPYIKLSLTNDGSSTTTFLRFLSYITEAVAPQLEKSANPVRIENLPTDAFGSLKCDTPVYLSPYKYSNSQWNVSAVTFASGDIKTGYESMKFHTDASGEAYGMVSDRGLFELRQPTRGGSLTFERYQGGSVTYQPATPMEIRFTAIFDAGSYSQPLTGRDKQFIGSGNVTDSVTATPRNFLGVGFSGSTDGITGSEFGIFYYRNSVETFIPQSDFNRNKLDGTGSPRFIIDTTKINVFSIDMGYLGASDIDFKILYDGEWILFHKFEFPNTLTQTHLSDPTMSFIAQMTVTIPSGGAPSAGTPLLGNGSYGIINYGNYAITDEHCYENSVSISASTETPILILRNAPTHFSKPNSILVSPLLLSLACDGTKNCVFRIYQTLSSNISGATWVDVDTDYSPVQYSVAGTLVSGSKVFVVALGKSGNTTINMKQFDILQNGDIAWMVTSFSTGTSDVVSAISWSEVH